MSRKRFFVFLWAVLFVPIAVGHARGGAKADCSECHDQGKVIAGTPHGGLACTDCHEGREIYPHPPGLPMPSCAECHEDAAERNRLGVHGMARAEGNGDAPDCGACHGDAHRVVKTGTEAFRMSVPRLCGTCHEEAFSEYRESVHGTSAAQGIVDAPVCSTCHGGHLILASSKGESPVFPTRIPETCGSCHGDVRLTERFRLPRMTIVSFGRSVHGLALRAGSEIVANCASCHGVHRILPSSDPRSTIHPDNLPETCGKCHPGAGTRFAIGHIHWGEGSPPPVSVRAVRTVYLILIPFTVGIMVLHNLADWGRKVAALRLSPGGSSEVPEGTEDTLGDPDFFRMYRVERIQHALLMVSFIMLTWTGFALIYPERWWARPFVAWEENWPVRGTLHRFFGFALILLSVFHCASLLASDRLRRHWRTLRPRASDVPEALGMFAYLLGLRRRRPVLPAHSYVEKVEYWAVVWGTFVMAATGIMLWANTFILAWMPKLALDIALAVHFYEAVLATLAIVVWHFYMVLFDPLVYPMDPAWITGYSVRRRAGEEISGEIPYDIPGFTEPGRGGPDGNGGEGPSP